MAFFVLLGIVFLCIIQSFVHATYPIDVRCGSSSNYRWLNLVQPQGISNCGYTIRPFGIYVCQLKVEFTTFLPNPVPLKNGDAPVCPDNNVIVIGRFKICGTNTNQHVYVDFNGTDLSNQAVISASVTTGTYSIKVTQIICPLGVRRGQTDETPLASWASRAGLLTPQLYDKYLVAPPGCDQYFIPSSGTVESFGFDYGRGTYPGSLTYNVCFKTSTSSSALRLTGLTFDLDGPESGTGVDDQCTSVDGNYDNIRLQSLGRIMENQGLAQSFCGNALQGKTVEAKITGTAMFTFSSSATTGFITGVKRVFKLMYEVK